MRRYVGRLRDLQDTLGALNDMASAKPMIATLKLTPEAAFAAGELAGLAAAGRARLLAQARRALTRLTAANLP